MSRYNYRRRQTTEVRVGNTGIGGANRVRLQSMTNTSTLDTAASAAQASRIAEAGGEIVRLTTQGRREAINLAEIKKALAEAGCDVPLVADVHFNPGAAFAAAAVTDKVRINPGNFIDPARTFVKLEFTDAEYAAELQRLHDTFKEFLDICRASGTAVRLGVNHGSLSDRIMSRYGDTPKGMVESVMEFLRVCREEDFHDIVISVKASNTVVMVATVRLLVETMEAEGMAYPIHLGVTEAGDGEDGRIKSAVGIGTLMAEGIGDTIRVSLSEDPEAEIPVAAAIRDYYESRVGHKPVAEPEKTPFSPSRQCAANLGNGLPMPAVAGVDFSIPDDCIYADASSDPALIPASEQPVLLTSGNANAVGEISSWIDRLYLLGRRNPIVVRLSFDSPDADIVRIQAAADFGTLLMNGYASAIDIDAPAIDRAAKENLMLSILQACRLRFTKTEYIACPSCGRTLFDLQDTLREVKEATSHLKGLKIGVMGCIVNGPGEMADADYGYVGAGPGRVSLYKGKQLMVKNITREEALPQLIALIKEGGDWHEP